MSKGKRAKPTRRDQTITAWLASHKAEGFVLGPGLELFRLECPCGSYKCKRILIQDGTGRLLWRCKTIDQKFNTVAELEEILCQTT